MCRDKPPQFVQEVNLLELNGREVYRNLQVRPSCRVLHGPGEYPLAQLRHQARPFSHRNEGPGGDFSLFRMRPSKQSFDPRNTARGGRYNWLVNEMKFILHDGPL